MSIIAAQVLVPLRPGVSRGVTEGIPRYFIVWAQFHRRERSGPSTSQRPTGSSLSRNQDVVRLKESRTLNISKPASTEELT